MIFPDKNLSPPSDAEILANIGKLNELREAYQSELDEQKRRQLNQQFAEIYRWFQLRDIPIHLDEKDNRYRLGAYV